MFWNLIQFIVDFPWWKVFAALLASFYLFDLIYGGY
jgi:hypothetical protein